MHMHVMACVVLRSPKCRKFNLSTSFVKLTLRWIRVPFSCGFLLSQCQHIVVPARCSVLGYEASITEKEFSNSNVLSTIRLSLLQRGANEKTKRRAWCHNILSGFECSQPQEKLDEVDFTADTTAVIFFVFVLFSKCPLQQQLATQFGPNKN